MLCEILLCPTLAEAQSNPTGTSALPAPIHPRAATVCDVNNFIIIYCLIFLVASWNGSYYVLHQQQLLSLVVYHVPVLSSRRVARSSLGDSMGGSIPAARSLVDS